MIIIDQFKVVHRVVKDYIFRCDMRLYPATLQQQYFVSALFHLSYS